MLADHVGWRHFLVAGVLAAVAFVLAPAGGVVEAAVFIAWNGAAVAAFAVGVRRHRTEPAWPWRLFVAAQVLYWLTTAGAFVYPLVFDQPVPFPSPLDALYGLALLGWIVPLVVGIRSRARHDRGAVWDAVILTAGVSTFVWIFVEPVLRGRNDLSGAVLGFSLMYLILFTLLAAVVVHAAVVPGQVRTVQVLLIGWLSFGLAGAGWYSFASTDGTVSHNDFWLSTLLLSFTLLGALGLHPRLPSLTAARGPEPTHRQPARLAALFLTGILPLLAVMRDVAAMNHHRREFDDTLVLLGVSVLVVLAIMVRLGLSARDLTEEQHLRGQLAHAASHDSLTGLANRVGFEPALQHALAVRHDDERAAMVLLADLDGFKAVNDTYGHEAGDELLRQVAVRLTDGVRDGDMVARLGGDEFAVVVDDIDMAEGLALTDRLAEAINRPIDIGPATPAISASIGLYRPEPGDDADEAMRRADTAMYAAKTAGGGVQLFDADRHRRFLDRYRLETELRTAPGAGELVVHYQPIVRLDDRRTVAAEALVRWQHPQRGLLLPDEFIEAAETSGAIIDLGRWLLRQACHDGARLHRQLDGDAGWLGITVNVSRRQLENPILVRDVTDALTDSALPADLLTLEVTETALADGDAMIAVMEELATLGVDLAMDDFGRGYSSLADLQRMPVNVLKIDRAFVTRIARSEQERTLTAAIVRLATSLGKRTLAEGIEDTDQLDHLTRLGCEYGQGYLFAGPMPFDELTAHLHAERANVP